jgi:hypothetical protein
VGFINPRLGFESLIRYNKTGINAVRSLNTILWNGNSIEPGSTSLDSGFFFLKDVINEQPRLAIFISSSGIPKQDFDE